MDSDVLARIEEQLKQIQNRLTRLEEKAASSLPSASPTPSLAPPPARPNPVSQSVAKSGAQLPRYSPPVGQAKPKDHSATNSTSSTGSVLGIVGVVCFILAAAFLVKMAIASGWLTPFRQWGLVGLFGIALSALGLSLRNKDNEYAGHAAGAGAAVLYFAAYSGHLIFGIYPPEVSIVIACVISMGCLGLFRVFSHDLFAIVAVVGTYLSPLILGYRHESMQLVSAYFVIWSLVFSYMSSTLKSRATSLTASYIGIGIFALINFLDFMPGHLSWIVAVQCLQFIIFVGGVIRYSIVFEEPMTETEANSYLPVLLFFYGTQYYFLSRWLPDLAPWCSLGFAGVLLAGYYFAKKALPEEKTLSSGGMVWLFASLVFLHAFYIVILPSAYKPVLLWAMLIGMLFVKDRIGKLSYMKAPLSVLSFIALMEYGKLIFRLIGEDKTPPMIHGLGLSITMIAVYFTTISRSFKTAISPFLLATHFLVILSLYRLVQAHGSLAVSLSWGGYSILVLGFAFSQKNWEFAKSSVVVLILAAAKALLYDVSQADPALRIVCLLLTGALLYFAGFLFRKIGQLEKSG